MKTRTRQRRTVELSADQEELAQQVYERIRGKMDEELLDMVRALMAKAPEEIFGPREFELRDRLNEFGATVLEESVNAQAKKGYQGASCACKCGGSAKYVNDRAKTLVSLLGDLCVTSPYYHCPSCGAGQKPWEAKLRTGHGEPLTDAIIAQGMMSIGGGGYGGGGLAYPSEVLQLWEGEMRHAVPTVLKDDGSGEHRYAIIAVGVQGRRTAASRATRAGGLAKLRWDSVNGANAYIIVRDGRDRCALRGRTRNGPTWRNRDDLIPATSRPMVLPPCDFSHTRGSPGKRNSQIRASDGRF